MNGCPSPPDGTNRRAPPHRPAAAGHRTSALSPCGPGWWPGGSRRVSARKGQCPGHCCCVESVGVELGGVVESQPLQPVFVLLVGGVVQNLHELGVAPDAAAVVGRG